jgi:hypothetical protein
MATVSPSTATGQALYENTASFRDHDDALDRKEGGVEVAEATEFSATELESILDCIRWMRGIMWADLARLELSAGGETSNYRDVTLQVVDTKGADLAEIHLVEMWLADTATGWECATAPDGGLAVQTGTAADVATAGKRIRVLTDATGTAVVRVTESTAKTFQVRARIGSKVSTLALAFA